jgi:hypothetical protein
MTAVHRRFNGDADLFDDDGNGPYDKRYPGRKVLADGGKVRVPIMLTDGMPDWMPPIKLVLNDAEMRDARQRADDARKAYIARISDAYRTQPLGAGGQPLTTAPGSDKPDDDDDDLSPREKYIKGLQNAYKSGSPSDANAIEAQREAWSTPGAKPGVTKDAAIADRARAYDDYVARLNEGWRR